MCIDEKALNVLDSCTLDGAVYPMKVDHYNYCTSVHVQISTVVIGEKNNCKYFVHLLHLQEFSCIVVVWGCGPVHRLLTHHARARHSIPCWK